MNNKQLSNKFVFLVLAVISSITACVALNVKYVHTPLVNGLISRNKDFNENIVGNPRNNRGVEVINENAVKNMGSLSSLQQEAATNNVNSGGEILLPKLFPLSPEEPTCEQLRAMWIFSKRQSRAAEITNEIPTYRDPFAYNVWEPYYSTTRSAGGLRMANRFGERARGPVFGRVVSREPLQTQRINFGQRQRHFGDASSLNRVYGAESKSNAASATGGANNARRPTQYRFIGGNGNSAGVGVGAAGNGINSAAVQGSFQKLKELIWTERAKELTQQRRAEEMAARAAVLKEIASGQNIFSPKNFAGETDSALLDENRSPDRDYQYMNDGRYPISSKLEKNKNNNAAQKLLSSSRTYFNVHRPGDISKTAAATTTLGNGRSTRLVNSNFDTDRNNIKNITKDLYAETMIKTYPVRPSYFRERNRMLFKQDAPEDAFERNTRPVKTTKLLDLENENENLLLNDAIRQLRNNIIENSQKLLLKQSKLAEHAENQQDMDALQSDEINYWESSLEEDMDNQKY